MDSRKCQISISNIAILKTKERLNGNVSIFEYRYTYSLNVHPIPLGNRSFLIKFFPVILPRAAGGHRTATGILHKWQKAEAEGCVLEAFGGGTEQEKLLCWACLKLRAPQ